MRVYIYIYINIHKCEYIHIHIYIYLHVLAQLDALDTFGTSNAALELCRH